MVGYDCFPVYLISTFFFLALYRPGAVLILTRYIRVFVRLAFWTDFELHYSYSFSRFALAMFRVDSSYVFIQTQFKLMSYLPTPFETPRFCPNDEYG
ncbi:hypothetical protein B0H13DRAFT_2662791 [Mycena leptocephala]|nr:hypothetical protein B0H13DRAFT_2666417 [Mycena leptocephala]KAJ7906374.1 hypothetical protein B0H13DRAFT_2662791 [Mycena leptocephala]